MESSVCLRVVAGIDSTHGCERSWPVRFEGRTVSIDPAIADGWGRIMADSQAAGRQLSADAFFAAVAQIHGLALVTRNGADFEVLKQPVFGPWAGEST
jgi:predicted nucleic acid-binding protein